MQHFRGGCRWNVMISFFSRDVLLSTHLGDCPWVKVKGAACIILTSINHSPHSVWDFSISVRIRTGRLCVVFDITFHQVEYKGRFFWAVPLKTHRKTFPVHLTIPYYILAVEFFNLFPSLIIFWLLKCGPRNVTRSTKDVRKKWRAHLPPPPRALRRLGWVSLVEWYAGGVFKCSCGSRCKERCTGWSSSASAGPGADPRSGSTTGPWPTCGPPATSHSVCPALGDPCWWSRARCSSGAWRIDGTKRWI